MTVTLRPLTEAWRRGIATAASRELLDWGRAQGVTTVHADVVAVLRKLGFVHVATGDWRGLEDHRYELRCG